MAVLSMTVRVGEVLLVGNSLALLVTEKKGQRIGLRVATMLSPIRIDPSGQLPKGFATGISGGSRLVEPEEAAAE